MSSELQARQGVLTARPVQPTTLGAPGVQRLDLGGPRDGLLYLPDPAAARPLIVLLHGANGSARDILRVVQRPAEKHSCVLLVPDSREPKWDFLIGGFGPDVRFIDQALSYTFLRCPVDPQRMAIAGFSDGASYALTLGMTNGDLFTHILAFSPGFMKPSRLADAPRIFIAHGRRDPVLPISECSRRIVPRLKELGYEPTYREFHGGHYVPQPIVDEALRWFLESPQTSR